MTTVKAVYWVNIYESAATDSSMLVLGLTRVPV